MATKQFTALKDFRYGTRMMRADDTVEMDAPTARLYTALGAIGPFKARRAAPKADAEPVAEAPAKPARKRKAAAKKK